MTSISGTSVLLWLAAGEVDTAARPPTVPSGLLLRIKPKSVFFAKYAHEMPIFTARC